MGIRHRINKKGSWQKPLNPNPDILQTRPFSNGKRAREPRLPTTQDILQTRPFSPRKEKPAPSQEMPDIQAQLEAGEKFGYNANGMPTFAPSEAALIQTKLTIGESHARDEEEAARVVSQINVPFTQSSAPEQTVQRKITPEETQLEEDYKQAVKDQDWSEVAVLLDGFSDQDLNTKLKKLNSAQRVAMYYTAPESATRVKDLIAKLDKIAGAATVADPEFEQIEKLYPNGITVAVYADYQSSVSGASEFVRVGGDFAKVQNAIALEGTGVAIGAAIPIKKLSEITVILQRIHLGLVEKYKQSHPEDNDTATPPQFTKIKNLALFAHGEAFGLGLHESNKFELTSETVKTFVSGLRDALVDDVNVQLYACNTGASRERIASKIKQKGDQKKGKDAASYEEWTEHRQDKRSGADSFAATLAEELGDESTVYGHTTAAHTTENFAARVFGQGAGGGEGGLHMFDVMYPESLIQDELKRLLPDRTEDEWDGLHDSLREQMWTHYKNSIGPKSKYAKDHYSIPIGREMFINSSNAQKLLQDDWQSKWIPDGLKEVKPKAKPKSAK